MTRASLVLWTAAGGPDPRKGVHETPGEAPCYWCGRTVGSSACRTRDVCSSSFTDHDVVSAPESPWICQACAWTMTGRPPDTLRLWSLVWREGERAAPSHPKAPDLGPEVHLTNKADPTELDRVLRDPPPRRWVCAVADTGQIHVVPLAVVNQGAGPWQVRYERLDVRSSPAEYARVAGAMQALLAAGFYKSDVESGAPTPTRLNAGGVALWRAHDAILIPYRGGALFRLALFLQRSPKKD